MSPRSDIPMDARKAFSQRLPDPRPGARPGVAVALCREPVDPGLLRAAARGCLLRPSVADPHCARQVHVLDASDRLDDWLWAADLLGGHAAAPARWLAVAAAEWGADTIRTRALDLRGRARRPLPGRPKAAPASALVCPRRSDRQCCRLRRHLDDHARPDRERLFGGGARSRARAPEQLRRGSPRRFIV